MIHHSYTDLLENNDLRTVEFPRVSPPVFKALLIIEVALQRYGLTRFYAMFSGGHDSLTATHVASQHPAFAGVIHVDTETGLKETREFVTQTCQRQNWPLTIWTPTMAKEAGYSAKTYEETIREYGCPGAAQHGTMYRYLKERPLRLAKATLEPNVKWMLSTGARSQESARRMGHIQPMRQDDSYVWINPVHDWSALQCSHYMKVNHLVRSIVKDTMHLSGECFCGCFAQEEELRMLDVFYPYQAERIRNWQQIAIKAGHTGDNAHWGHGSQIPDEQTEMFPMCWFCRGDAA